MRTLSITLLLACGLLCACAKKQENWSCSCDVKPAGSSTTTNKTLQINDKTSTEASEACEDFGKATVQGNGTWACKTTPA
jgi:hypothetical protein